MDSHQKEFLKLKDSGNLMLLVSLWNEVGGSLGNLFVREPRGGRVASPFGHCPSTLPQRCGG
jgi:hypothetical protein